MPPGMQEGSHCSPPPNNTAGLPPFLSIGVPVVGRAPEARASHQRSEVAGWTLTSRARGARHTAEL